MLLPLAEKSDFVLHYRGAAHKLLLTLVSSYSRTYMAPLMQRQRSYPAEECKEHSSIDHCIRLPDSCGKPDATVDDFRRFIRPAVLSSALTVHAVPWTTTTDELRREPRKMYEPVLSLCHYFDMPHMLARMESNLMLAALQPYDGEESWPPAWQYFLLAVQFGLQRAKKV